MTRGFQRLWGSRASCRVMGCGSDAFVGTCQCNDGCTYFNDCCPDYHSFCAAGDSAGAEVALEGSCREFGCGSNGVANCNLCDCSELCSQNGNCCHDYQYYCVGTGDAEGDYGDGDSYDGSYHQDFGQDDGYARHDYGDGDGDGDGYHYQQYHEYHHHEYHKHHETAAPAAAAPVPAPAAMKTPEAPETTTEVPRPSPPPSTTSTVYEDRQQGRFWVGYCAKCSVFNILHHHSAYAIPNP
eukprot:Skav212443  [mRNA]  locus=scaffold1094:68681:74634:- [translate_table: standard]